MQVDKRENPSWKCVLQPELRKEEREGEREREKEKKEGREKGRKGRNTLLVLIFCVNLA
jgi:hypothetical protein